MPPVAGVTVVAERWEEWGSCDINEAETRGHGLCLVKRVELNNLSCAPPLGLWASEVSL